MVCNNLRSALLKASYHRKFKDNSEAQKFAHSAVYLLSSFYQVLQVSYLYCILDSGSFNN